MLKFLFLQLISVFSLDQAQQLTDIPAVRNFQSSPSAHCSCARHYDQVWWHENCVERFKLFTQLSYSWATPSYTFLSVDKVLLIFTTQVGIANFVCTKSVDILSNPGRDTWADQGQEHWNVTIQIHRIPLQLESLATRSAYKTAFI